MITVLGEAVVELVETAERGVYRAHPGGSPLNVAVGLARLGQPTTLLARLSGDAFGGMFRRRLAGSGVDLSRLVDAPEPTGARWAPPAAPRCATSTRALSPHSSTRRPWSPR